MSCRKCKNQILEGDDEYYIVHQWEAHGVRLDESDFPTANWELVKELKLHHRVTGQASAEKMFGKKATRKLL